MTQDFFVVAVSQPEFHVSKHGVSSSRGGTELHRELFQFPDTPYYMACEMVQELYPSARVSVVVKYPHRRD